MSRIGIIGGTALRAYEKLENAHEERMSTPYGDPSSGIVFGTVNDVEIVYLNRHGLDPGISPHLINYRANLWALKQLDVTDIVSVFAVGGITEHMSPSTIVIPDQIIDYTSGREHTFCHEQEPVHHFDFTWPYDVGIRTELMKSAVSLNLPVISNGTYAAVQGPRLETAAEIKKLERDGCDVVGMTGMPEAALARELELRYAAVAVVVNWAAGKGNQIAISLSEIEIHIKTGMDSIHKLLETALPAILET